MCNCTALAPGCAATQLSTGSWRNRTLKVLHMTPRFRGIVGSVIRRLRHVRQVAALLKRNPVVAILGARQVGKTTLARQVFAGYRGKKTWFDLEDPRVTARLAEPMLVLEPLKGLVVLDEIQHSPGLFGSLRVLADRPGRPCRFLVLGSASPSLLRQGAESLAGRIAYYELFGFSAEETGLDTMPELWLRGGFPLSYLADSDSASLKWRRDFVRSFLERDLPQLGIGVPSLTLRRFWTMLAHYHAQTWNGSELGRALGVSDTTVRRYLEDLAGAYMVRVLSPWHENLGKRQVRAPKVYLADSGLLHYLLDIRDRKQLEMHPKVGASWEGFALHETLQHLRAQPEECYFWATHSGAELDLLVVRGQQRLGFEFKRTELPALTPSMRHALKDLRLDRLWVIHVGREQFPLSRRVQAIGLADLLREKTLA
jgi:predicted AAA+ superfamily ATPase